MRSQLRTTADWDYSSKSSASAITTANVYFRDCMCEEILRIAHLYRGQWTSDSIVGMYDACACLNNNRHECWCDSVCIFTYAASVYDNQRGGECVVTVTEIEIDH